MNVVYEPKGRAKEYSELACNLYMGCTHGCRYCFAPSCMRKTPEEWHANVPLRKDAIKFFEKDAEKLHATKDERPILFSFLSDPYQPLEKEAQLTHQALEIARFYHLKTKILTKGSAELIRRDFHLMKQAGTQLGITVCFVNDETRRYWEPMASTVDDRFAILQEAHEMGIYTWVSLEPVIVPEEALSVIERIAPFVDLWKVGKLNHMKDVEKQVNWFYFREKVENLLKRKKAIFYIKDDLRQIQEPSR